MFVLLPLSVGALFLFSSFFFRRSIIWLFSRWSIAEHGAWNGVWTGVGIGRSRGGGRIDRLVDG